MSQSLVQTLVTALVAVGSSAAFVGLLTIRQQRQKLRVDATGVLTTTALAQLKAAVDKADRAERDVEYLRQQIRLRDEEHRKALRQRDEEHRLELAERDQAHHSAMLVLQDQLKAYAAELDRQALLIERMAKRMRQKGVEVPVLGEPDGE